MLKSYSTIWPYLCVNQFYKCFTSYSTAIRIPPFKNAKYRQKPILPRSVHKKYLSRGNHMVSDPDLLLFCDSIRPIPRQNQLCKEAHQQFHDQPKEYIIILFSPQPGVTQSIFWPRSFQGQLQSSKFSISHLKSHTFPIEMVILFTFITINNPCI